MVRIGKRIYLPRLQPQQITNAKTLFCNSSALELAPALEFLWDQVPILVSQIQINSLTLEMT
jgi:hypothetical protein